MTHKRYPVIQNGITYWKCSKCRELKTVDDFHKNNSTPNGLRYYCKPCATKSVKDWQSENLDWVKAYDIAYKQTPNGRVAINKAQERTNAKYPQKVFAREQAYLARDRGDLIRQPCEICNATEDVHSHHDDYGKPLEVRWLCRTHHNEYHKKELQNVHI